MKKFLFTLCLLSGMLCFGLSDVVMAQTNYRPNSSWIDYIGDALFLYDYGRYQDGRCIDKFKANAENGNEGECIIYGKTHCYWKNCQGKPQGYTDFFEAKIDGNKLYLYRDGREHNVLTYMSIEPHVMRMKDGSKRPGVIIFTVDKYGWYRRFWIYD